MGKTSKRALAALIEGLSERIETLEEKVEEHSDSLMCHHDDIKGFFIEFPYTYEVIDKVKARVTELENTVDELPKPKKRRRCD